MPDKVSLFAYWIIMVIKAKKMKRKKNNLKRKGRNKQIKQKTRLEHFFCENKL